MKNGKNTKMFAIAMMAVFIGAIFASAWSASVLSTSPVKVITLAVGKDPSTTLKLSEGLPSVGGWNTTKVNVTLTTVRAAQVDNDDRIQGVWYQFEKWNVSTGAWAVIKPWTNYTIVNNTISIWTNGTIRISYNATDKGGDTEVTNTTIVKIDMSAPTMTAPVLTGTTGNFGWYKSQVNITLKANDTDKWINSSGLKNTVYSIGSAAAVNKTYVNQTEMAAGVTFDVSAQGTTLVNYSSSDNASNEVKKNLTVKIDSVAPTMTLPGAALKTKYFNFTATDATSTVSTVTVSIDGAAATTVTGASGAYSINTLTAGTYNVTVTVTDVAGNSASETVKVTVTLDTATDYTMYIIIIVIIVVVVVVVVLMMRKGKGKAADVDVPADAPAAAPAVDEKSS